MKKRKFRVVSLLIVIISCYVGYTLFQQQVMINRINKDIEMLSKEYKDEEDANAFLKEQIEFAKTKEYKERMARERIGLIMPGETVYIIDYIE